jgi:hypothetical protein
MQMLNRRKEEQMPLDPTAGRSAGTPRNADLDPMGPAGTPRNAELDPMGRSDVENARRAFASLNRELTTDRNPTGAGRRPLRFRARRVD